MSAALDPPPNLLVRAVARLAGWLLRGRDRGPVRPESLRRVLVVRPDDRVGNALLTIPLVRALQRLLPAARVDLLLAANRALVAEGLPDLDVVRFDKRDLFRRPLRFLRALWSLRSYDAAIDASHWHAVSLTAALLARWASRGAVVGIQRSGFNGIYSVALPLPPFDQPDVTTKLDLLRGLGLAPPATPALETGLALDAATLGQRDAALSGLGLSPGGYLAINPGGRKADHRWPPEKFGAVAAALAPVRSLIFWGPGEEALAAAVAAASSGAAIAAPPTDLPLLAAYFRGAAAVLTNDTGPMHLAVACGAPVVAIQLSEDAVRWSHPGPGFAGVPARPDAADPRGERPIAIAADAVRRFVLTHPAAAPQRAHAAGAAPEEK